MNGVCGRLHLHCLYLYILLFIHIQTFVLFYSIIALIVRKIFNGGFNGLTILNQILLLTGLFVLQYVELHKCTVTSVSELAHSWGVFQYTVCSLVVFVFILKVF